MLKLLQNMLFVKIVLYISSALEFGVFKIHKNLVTILNV